MINKDIKNSLQPVRVLTSEPFKIILPVIILSGILLRIINIGAESLTFDEIYSVRLAKMSLGGIITETSYDFHPPLYYFLLHFWTSVFGYGEIAVRMLSVVFGVLGIWAAYVFAKLIFDKKTGIFAAFLFSFSYMNILASQETRMYSMLVLLSILSMYFLLRMLSNRGNYVWIPYLATNILLLHTHVYSFFILAAEVFYFFSLSFYSKRRFMDNLIRFVSVQALTAMVFIPWFFVLYRQFIVAQKYLWIPKASIFQIPEALIEYSGSLLMSLIMIPLLIFSVFQISRVLKVNAMGKFAGNFEDIEFRLSLVNTGEAYFLFIWMSLPVLIPFILSQFLSPIFLVKYTLASCAAFIFLAARGLNNITSRYLRLSLIVLIVIFSTYNMVNDWSTRNKENWRDAIRYLDENANSGDLVIFNSGGCRYMYDYYTNRTDLKLFSFDPTDSQIDKDSILTMLKPVINNRNRTWLVFSHTRDWNGIIPKTLEQASDSSSLKTFYSDYRKYLEYEKYSDLQADLILMRQYSTPDIKLYLFSRNSK